MRTPSIALSLLGTALLGCEPRAAIEARFDGEQIYRCHDAVVLKLESPGGWKFECRDESVIYFFYEPAGTPGDDIVDTITVVPAKGPKLRDMKLVANPDTLDCPNADTARGGQPFPVVGRKVAVGTYAFDLVDPCGTLDIVIEHR